MSLLLDASVERPDGGHAAGPSGEHVSSLPDIAGLMPSQAGPPPGASTSLLEQPSQVRVPSPPSPPSEGLAGIVNPGSEADPAPAPLRAVAVAAAAAAAAETAPLAGVETVKTVKTEKAAVAASAAAGETAPVEEGKTAKAARSVIDPSELDFATMGSFTRNADQVDGDIQAIFPDAAQNAEAAEKAMASAKPKGKKAKTADEAVGASLSAGGRMTRKERRHGRGKTNIDKISSAIPPSQAATARAEVERAAAVTAAGGDSEGAKSEPGKTPTRDELRAKLHKKKEFLSKFGSRGTRVLSQMDTSIDDLADAARAEARGERVPAKKQEEMMSKTKGLLGNALKGMGAQERRLLSRKSEDIMPMATNLLKKVLGGVSRKKGKGAKTKAAGSDSSDGDSESDGEGDLPSELQELVDSVSKPAAAPENTRASRRQRRQQDMDVEPDELPLRPRTSTRGAANKSAPDTKPDAPATMPNGEPLVKGESASQKKNRKKREKVKLLKQQAAVAKTTPNPS